MPLGLCLRYASIVLESVVKEVGRRRRRMCDLHMGLHLIRSVSGSDATFGKATTHNKVVVARMKVVDGQRRANAGRRTRMTQHQGMKSAGTPCVTS